jgi:hypothetical protein
MGLGFQLFALARGVLALACYFCDVLCIRAGRAAISLPFFGHTVARGTGAFRCRGHGISFFSSMLFSLKRGLRAKGLELSHRMASESVPKAFLLARLSSIAPTQTTICLVLLNLCPDRSVISDDLCNSVVSE